MEHGYNVAYREVPLDWQSGNLAPVGELVQTVLKEMVTPGKVFALTDPDELRCHGMADGEKHPVVISSATTRGVLLLCAAPTTFRERSVLEMVCAHYENTWRSELVNLDEVLEGDGAIRGNLSAKISLALAEEKRLIVCITTAHAEKIRRTFDGHVPAGIAFVLLQPTAINVDVVQWSLFQSVAHPMEYVYRERFRKHGTRKINYVNPAEDLPVSGQEVLTADQHSRLSDIYRQVGVDLKKCVEVKLRLEGVQLSTPLHYVPLDSFWTRLDCVPGEIADVGGLIRLSKEPGRDKQPRVCQVVHDMISYRGFFELTSL